MKVHVSKLRNRSGETIRLNLTQELPAMEAGGETVTFAAPVTLELDGVFDGRIFHFSGKLETVLGLTCSRCLGQFAFPLQADFSARFLSSGEGRKGEPDEAELDEIETFVGDEVDLTDKVLEQVLLALPMKALCRSDCQGLCPQCGTDLNLDSCQCEPTSVDPRFAALERWLSNKRARS